VTANHPVGGDPARPAFTEERRAEIIRLVMDRGRVRTSELAEFLGVTEPTIRRDVADLDRQGLLHRTHGGAIAAKAPREASLSTRAGVNRRAKVLIGRACCDLVHDGDAIFLDSGSTVESIAEAIRDVCTQPAAPMRDIAVLTNAVGVAILLADVPGVRCTILGGTYRALGGCLVGPVAVENLSRFSVATAFIGVSGLSEEGFTVSDLGDAQLKSAAMERSRRVVVPMDIGKVGATDFRQLCALDKIDTLVVDQADDEVATRCGASGVEVIVATGDEAPARPR
jgi:DeoR/GlpR family transcriptional regulator of sugar metabolism